MNSKLATVAAAILSLTACAGGGGGSGGTSTPTMPSKTTSGVITGFGSVFVNGVEYETTATNVTVDGAASDESELQVGMVVNLAGTVDANGTTGVATEISFNDEIEGFVTAVYDGAAGTIGVMGQMVHITADTVFDSDDSNAATPTADSLIVGDAVEISGYSSGDGNIYATRVALKPAKSNGEEIELKGVVTAVTSIAADTGSFKLGDLTVLYDATTQLEVANGIANGLFVEVKFLNSADTLAGLTGVAPSLLASKIELEGDGIKGEQGDEGEEIELQGTVTAVDLANSLFMLNGQTVYLSADTEYEDGVTNSSTDLAAGGRVEVEGEFNADGELVAKHIEFGADESNIVETSGTVVSYDATTQLLTFTQTGSGESISVTVNNMTIVKDESASAERYFNAASLVANNAIEVNYDATSMIATKLERE